MPTVKILRSVALDTFVISPQLLTSGYINGTAFTLDSTGSFAIKAAGDNVMFVSADSVNELASPPSGALLTGIYGSGSKILIDHTPEVKSGSNDRAYENDVPNANVGALLYFSANGKWTTASSGNTFPKGIMFQKPTVSNNYTLGVILRF